MALHVRGESRFVDDLPRPAGMLHAVVLGSPAAHGRIRRLDISKALPGPGCAACSPRRTCRGRTRSAASSPDEPLLAEAEVHYVGQPVALVVADTDAAWPAPPWARVELEIEELPAVFDPREAFRQGLLIAPPRTFAVGDVDAAWTDCDVVVEGRADTGAQEHLYLETQGALAAARRGRAAAR